MNSLELLRPYGGAFRGAMCLLLSSCLIGLAPAGYGQTEDLTKLIGKLKEKRPDARARVVDALVKIGAPAVDPLIAALKDPNSTVRDNALTALGRIGDPRAVEPLIAVIRDSDVAISFGAAQVLRRFNDPRAIEPLLADMSDPNPTVRGWATLALCETMDTRAIEPMIAVLNDKALGARFAAHALSRTGDPRAAGALLAALWANDSIHLNPVIIEVYPFFLGRGEAGSEPVLINALMDPRNNGNAKMAEDFFNSGNAKLADAARIWASLNGYQIKPSSSAGAIKWGSTR
jgi:hypothetical protein